MNQRNAQANDECGAPRRRRARGRAAAGATLITLGLAVAISIAGAACSLGNIHHDDCTSNDQCVAAFGLGSTCDKGFCTASSTKPDCLGKDPSGNTCVIISQSCPVDKNTNFHTTCTDAMCAPFDKTRLTNLAPDGGLPPLP